MPQPAAERLDQTKLRSPPDLLSLLTPRSVAVVGANDKIDSFSGGSIFNLRRHGYMGDIYPINPGRAEVRA